MPDNFLDDYKRATDIQKDQIEKQINTITLQEYKQRLIRESAEKAQALNIPGRGHNDAIDAFRHAYSIALITYDLGHLTADIMGIANEIEGDLLKNQPAGESRMDTFNNAVGRNIGRNVNNREEIAQKVYDALVKGEMIINPDDTAPRSPFNDDEMPESDTSDPMADTLSSSQSAIDALPSLPSNYYSTGGIFTAIGDFFGGVAERIGGTLGLGGGGRSGAAALSGFGFRRVGLDPGILERLLKDGLDTFTDRLAENLSRNSNVAGNALGRTLAQNTGLFGDILRKGRIGEFGDSLEDVLFGGKASNGFGLVGDFIGNAVAGGIGQLLGGGRTRTTSYETDRSRSAVAAWQQSRAQQQAQLAQMVQRGMRNL